MLGGIGWYRDTIPIHGGIGGIGTQYLFTADSLAWFGGLRLRVVRPAKVACASVCFHESAVNFRSLKTLGRKVPGGRSPTPFLDFCIGEG